jgi:hypothetical protein
MKSSESLQNSCTAIHCYIVLLLIWWAPRCHVIAQIMLTSLSALTSNYLHNNSQREREYACVQLYMCMFFFENVKCKHSVSSVNYVLEHKMAVEDL